MGDYFKKLAEDMYNGFLTPEEIDTVVAGHDLWMDSDEVVIRLDANKHDYIYTGHDLDEILNKKKKLPIKKKRALKTQTSKK